MCRLNDELEKQLAEIERKKWVDNVIKNYGGLDKDGKEDPERFEINLTED